MKYRFSSLAGLAEFLDIRAKELEDRAVNIGLKFSVTDRRLMTREASTYRLIADLIRNTVIDD